MDKIPNKPVLLTGASGNIGRALARQLSEAGWTLRLSDVAPFPGELPPNATFRQADLGNAQEVVRLVEGCGFVAHFGGASTDEASFEAILNANLRGLHHIYEGARLAGARVLFASSNHVTGFHKRTDALDTDCAMLPDSFYGLSKAYGEMMGRLYWTKHRVESVLVRIGSCFPEPADERMLSTWLSYADIGRLVVVAATAPEVGCATVWGASANARTFWRHDDRAVIGWQPQDSADAHAARVTGKLSGDPVAEAFQGGLYCARN